MTEEVLVEARDGVQIITINRPQAKNALNTAVSHAIAAAADGLDANPNLKVGILTGAGGVFSAGMDLKAFAAGEVPSIEGRGLGGITVTPPKKPMIAAVEGWALAGGFELVLACDMVVAGNGARFGVPEAKRALFAAAGGAALLPRRIAPAVALEMLLTGDPIDAARAAALGLVNRLTDDGSALEGALALASTIAANGPLALEATKYLANNQADWTLKQLWAENDALWTKISNSEDALEGAASFAAKRDPVWHGR